MIASIEKLSKLLHLNLEKLEEGDNLVDFPLQVPESFVARIKPGDIDDPLLLQVFPQELELQEDPDFVEDPLAEKDNSPVPVGIRRWNID
jgi:L-lysine 2,3-aminomutase